MTRSRRTVAGILATALAGGVLVPLGLSPATAAPPAAPQPAPQAAPTDPAAAALAGDRTSAKERRRVDRVKTPKLRWYTCYGTAKCATAKVPRDYDKPNGPKVNLALLKRPARDQSAKIGSLFVNPGGPGVPGIDLALFAPYIFGDEVLERFDVVGFDPRGTGFSTNVKCFSSVRKQTPVLTKIYSRAFPVGTKEEKSIGAAYAKQAKACSTTGKPLSASVSTAEVARDMDVLRRAVGDKKLSYLGFSYGSYLGQVYANLFPDRVRAVAIDGVLDPKAWAGTNRTKANPQWNRIRSADASWRSLREIFTRCDAAGPTRCLIAGGAAAKFDLVARRLKSEPMLDVDPSTGDTFVFGYAEFVGVATDALYYTDAGDFLTFIVADLLEATDPAGAGAAAQKAAAAKRAAAVKRVTKDLRHLVQRRETPTKRPAGFPYDSSLDSFASIACTDSLNTASLKRLGAIGAAADARAKYFGRLWVWNNATCTAPQWKVKDEDAYRGSFTRRTANPVLVVGNLWDPVTNYDSARTVSRLLPNSGLLTSRSWGHTAYGTSECATSAMDGYLLTAKLPATRVCTGDDQPFQRELEEEEEPESLRTAAKSMTNLGLLRPRTAPVLKK